MYVSYTVFHVLYLILAIVCVCILYSLSLYLILAIVCVCMLYSLSLYLILAIVYVCMLHSLSLYLILAIVCYTLHCTYSMCMYPIQSFTVRNTCYSMCMYPTLSSKYLCVVQLPAHVQYLNGFRLPGVDVCDSVVVLLVKCHSFGVVEGTQQVCLDGV